MNPFDLENKEAIEDDNCPIKAIEEPHFCPAIPEHLIQGMTPTEKYLYATLSVGDQRSSWQTEQIIAQNLALRDLWRKQTSADRWRRSLNSKWAIVAWLSAIATATGVAEAIKTLINKVH